MIDDTGITVRQKTPTGEIDPYQIKITGRNIVFTDDAWQTSKTALGALVMGDDELSYGINAQNIIGDMIIGNNMRILDNNGNDLMTVVDGKIQTQVSDLDGRITQMSQTVNGFELRFT